MKILLLEDSRIDTEIIRQFFYRKTEHSLSVVSCEADALKSLKELHPDVFLVDVIIQGEAVHNLVELAIKKNLTGAVIPLAVNVQLDERRFYQSLGCPTIITKPFTREDLAAALSQIQGKAGPAVAGVH